MATVKYDLVATAGTYTDRNGNEKKRYIKCGVVMEGEKGMSAKIESLPVGFNGWLSFFEPKQAEDAPKSRRSAAQDDDVPF